MSDLSWAVFENTKRRLTINLLDGEPFSFNLYDAKLNRDILSKDISRIGEVCFADYTTEILERAEKFLKEIEDKEKMKKRGMSKEEKEEIEDNIKKDVKKTRRRLLAHSKKNGMQKTFWQKEHEELWDKYRKYVYKKDGYGGYERDRLIDTYPLLKFDIWCMDYMSNAR